MGLRQIHEGPFGSERHRDSHGDFAKVTSFLSFLSFVFVPGDFGKVASFPSFLSLVFVPGNFGKVTSFLSFLSLGVLGGEKRTNDANDTTLGKPPRIQKLGRRQIHEVSKKVLGALGSQWSLA